MCSTIRKARKEMIKPIWAQTVAGKIQTNPTAAVANREIEL